MRWSNVLLLGAASLPFVFCLSASAAPDYWDTRLNQVCGLYLEDKAATVPAGLGYWRLTRGEFENEQQSSGNHHIYYKCLDKDGNPIENQQVWASKSYISETDFYYQFTKGSIDGYWGNYALFVGTCAGTAMCGPSSPGPWPFNAYVDTASSPRGYAGPSDKVYGMGMTSPQGTGCGAHVNFRLTWRWTISSPPLPVIERSPASFTRSVAQGLNLSNDSFTIRNIGGDTMIYTISDDATWLSTTPNNGTATGSEIDTIAIEYSTASLALGTYNATITIASTNATNSPQLLPVSLTVRLPGYLGDFDADGDVDQSDFGHMQECLTETGQMASAGCMDARLDIDVDVDQEDLVLFLGCFFGSGHAPPINCFR